MVTRTHKKYVSLWRLQATGKGSLIVRLMMACNDIRLANQCMQNYRRKDTPTERHLRRGALMYFVRLQIGHLLEGLKVLEDIDSNRDLFKSDLRDDLETQFDQLLASFRGQPFRRYTEGARDKTFHYSDSEVNKAITARIEKGSNLSGFTLSPEPELYRFDIADDIYDSMLCRIVWNLPPDQDLGPNADKVLDEVWNIGAQFLEFCERLVVPILRQCFA